MTGPERAREDLAEILSPGRVEMSEAMALVAERGHPAGRTDRARRALEVETVREGPVGSRQTFYWQLPTTCPTCLRPFGPVEVPASAPWGWNRVDNGDYWREATPAIEPPSVPLDAQAEPSQPTPLPNYGPPRCNVCGKASAVPAGSGCPFWTTAGQRCRGVVQ